MASAFVTLWLGFAFVGLLGLLHAAYSKSPYYYLGFGLALLSAAGIVSLLAITIFS